MTAHFNPPKFSLSYFYTIALPEPILPQKDLKNNNKLWDHSFKLDRVQPQNPLSRTEPSSSTLRAPGHLSIKDVSGRMDGVGGVVGLWRPMEQLAHEADVGDGQPQGLDAG